MHRRKREQKRNDRGRQRNDRGRQTERDSLLPVEAVHEAHFPGFEIFYWSSQSHGASLLLLLLDLHGLITFTAFTVIATRAQTREGEQGRERDRERGNERETFVSRNSP